MSGTIMTRGTAAFVGGFGLLLAIGCGFGFRAGLHMYEHARLMGGLSMGLSCLGILLGLLLGIVGLFFYADAPK